MNNLKLALAPVFALVSLSGCNVSQEQAEIVETINEVNETDVDLKVSYKLPKGLVNEFVSTDQLIIAVDGRKASGIAVLPYDPEQVGSMNLLKKYSLPTGSFFEFTPALHQGAVCVYVDSRSSGALDCWLKKEQPEKPSTNYTQKTL